MNLSPYDELRIWNKWAVFLWIPWFVTVTWAGFINWPNFTPIMRWIFIATIAMGLLIYFPVICYWAWRSRSTASRYWPPLIPKPQAAIKSLFTPLSARNLYTLEAVVSQLSDEERRNLVKRIREEIVLPFDDNLDNLGDEIVELMTSIRKELLSPLIGKLSDEEVEHILERETGGVEKH